jgi:hypothetical protein
MHGRQDNRVEKATTRADRLVDNRVRVTRKTTFS